MQHNVAIPEAANFHDGSDDFKAMFIKYKSFESEKTSGSLLGVSNFDMVFLLFIVTVSLVCSRPVMSTKI